MILPRRCRGSIWQLNLWHGGQRGTVQRVAQRGGPSVLVDEATVNAFPSSKLKITNNIWFASLCNWCALNYPHMLTADLSTVRIPEGDTLELAAELGDVLQHGLGLPLHVPLPEDLRLGVELRVSRVLLGTLRPLPQRLNTETTSLTRTLALAPTFRIFHASVRAVEQANVATMI